jgi:hypothetical protein
VISLIVQLLIVIAACVEVIATPGAQIFSGVVVGYCRGDISYRLSRISRLKDAP